MAKVIKSTNPNSRRPWTVRYWHDGKQSERSFATKREADDHAAKVEHDKRARIFIDPKLGDVLFRDYAATWLAQHPGASNSLKNYRTALNRHINPVIGDTALRRITRDQVRKLLLETLPAKPLGHAAIETCRLVIASVLGEAVKAKRITESPAAGIRLPKVQEAAEFYAPSRAQLEVLTRGGTERAHGPRDDGMPGDWQLAVWLMRGCGLRIGEALAVSEGSVRGELLRVSEQVLDKPLRLGPLKHRKPGEFRDIPLPRWVADEIDKHIKEHGATEDGHLFPRRNMESFRQTFARHAKAAQLPESFTPHDLRHVFASVALAGGVPVTDVSRYLGHRSVDLTYRIYSHFIPSSLDTARNVLDSQWAAAA